MPFQSITKIFHVAPFFPNFFGMPPALASRFFRMLPPPKKKARTSAYKAPLAAAIGPFVSLLYMCDEMITDVEVDHTTGERHINVPKIIYNPHKVILPLVKPFNSTSSVMTLSLQ